MSKKYLPIDPQLVRTVLDYDSSTGLFTWRERHESIFNNDTDISAIHRCRRWNSAWANKPAFNRMDSCGYLSGSIFNTRYFAHRVAWAYHYGVDVPHEIDHINGVKTDNRIDNLRLATHNQNMRNIRIRCDNTSGHKGVSLDKKSGKFHAYIRHKGKRINIGYYADLESAAMAYRKKADQLHGDFKNYG